MTDLSDFKRVVHEPMERQYHALDRAARSYRHALREILEDCGHDRPDIGKIRAHAEQGIRAADYEIGNA